MVLVGFGPQGSSAYSGPVPILCLGEAIVDLICERGVGSPADADRFRPHFGGALANVAVAARRAGADAALAGGVGDDEFGIWLRGRLAAEEVDLRWFSLVPGIRTALAITTFDADREPSFRIYGDDLQAALMSLEGRLSEAIGESSALVFGSNTLVGEAERALTRRARQEAVDRGIPVLFDPNLRPTRWDDLERARRLSAEAAEGAFVIRANLEEARWLTGLDAAGTAEAAVALCELGAEFGVVTNGPAGAVMRGAAEADVPAAEIDLVSPLGAGDAFMGALAAALAELEWDARGGAAALPTAVEAGTAACRHWGALS